MSAVREKIIERIRNEGPVTFREFMRMALYEPGAGYYTRPQTEIGRAGDFYTGPHLHAAFGWMLAKQVEEMWLLLGKGPLEVTEQGPGKGYLAKDILDRLKDRNAPLYDAIGYRLVELNPGLREFQEELLRGHAGKVSWADSLKSGRKAASAPGVKGVLLANELLDAFPVHLVQMHNGAVREVRVGFESGAFTEVLASPSTPEIEEYLDLFVPESVPDGEAAPAGEPAGFSDERSSPSAGSSRMLPDGYRTEVNLEVRGWLREVSDVLGQGFIIAVDYGYPSWDYYGSARDRGTLLGYYRHRVVEDPYMNPGEMDITAHVNFSALNVFGRAAGFKCAGFCPQGTYLVSLGIEEVLAGLGQDDIMKLKGLLLPGTMGETHKVMALYKGPDAGGAGKVPELRGFKMRNQCRFL